MKRRIPNYHPDQKGFLSSIDRFILRPAKSAGEVNLIIDTATLEWLLKVANRAPRTSGGRPSNSLRPKRWRDAEVAKAREGIAKLKADGKKPGGRPPTDKQISTIIVELANLLNVKESYAEELLTRKPRKKKAVVPT
jgi:hypothetical protein